MRFTSITSRYAYYLAASAGIIALPHIVAAATITTDGCFERTPAVYRMTTPACTMQIDGSIGETVEVTIENLDPDAVIVDDSGINTTVKRNARTIELTGSLTSTSATIEFTPWLEQNDDLWFVAVSDNQARGTVESNPIFEELLALINVVRPDFITNSGDLVQGSSNTAVLNDMFQSVINTMSDSTVPMYVTAGNHDYNPELTAFKSYFGNPDYVFEYGPARFVWLSTAGSTPRGRVSNDQLTWLNEAFNDTTKQRITVVHHPLVVPSWGSSQCCYEYSSERDALANALSAEHVDQIISGHSQGYDERTLTSADVDTITNPLQLLVTGGAGGNIAQPEGKYHFTLLHVTPTGITRQPFYFGDTVLAMDATDNRGNSTHPSLTVEYSGETDLPFIRLKFKVKGEHSNYLVADDVGHYWPYQVQAFGKYSALYAQASLVKDTTTTFTATPATTLHAGTDQTVNTQGEVQYTETPTSTNANTRITAKPSEGTLTIVALEGSDGNYQWTETRTASSASTRYSVDEVATNRQVYVYVNDVLSERLQPNERGVVEFTIDDASAERRLRIATRLITNASEVHVVPSSGGAALVRAFSVTGNNIRNWYAFNRATGHYFSNHSYVTNQMNPDVFVYRTDSQRLETHTYTGNRLASQTATALPAFSNLVGDDRLEEHVTIGNRVYTYKWSNTKQAYVTLDGIQLPKRWQLISTAAVGQQLVTIQRHQRRLYLVAYQWENSQWRRVQRSRLSAGFTQAQLTPCTCDGSESGVVLVLSGHSKLKAQLNTYQLQQDTWKRRSHIELSSKRVLQLTAGYFISGLNDTLGVVDDGHRAHLYTWHAKGRLERITTPLHNVESIAFAKQHLVVTSVAPSATITTYQWTKHLQAVQRWSAYGQTFPGTVSVVY